MPTTLTNGATTLTLAANAARGDDFTWPDEFAWTAVQTTTSFSWTGALMIDRGIKLAGRPITLQGGDTWGWIARATVQQLQAWADAGATGMVLSYRGSNYTVEFDTERGAPVDVQPLVDFADPSSTAAYYGALRFITTA